MIYGNTENTTMRHWANWAAEGIEKELLFYQVSQLVEDKVKEIVPPLIENYLNTVKVNVETTLNGKAADLSGLKEDIERLAVEEVIKAFR